MGVLIIVGLLVLIFIFFRDKDLNGGLIGSLQTNSPEEMYAKIWSRLESGESVDDLRVNLASKKNLTKDEESYLASLSFQKYNDSQREEDLLKYINDLKAIVLDPNQTNMNKSTKLNELATLFCGIGRDDSTFRKVFEGEPFQQYWVEGDGALSAKKLLEWSYSEFGKRPMSAIFLSRWYVNRTLVRDLDKQTIAENVLMAKKYLKEADQLVKELSLKDKYYTSYYEFRIYRFWRTFIIEGLRDIDPKSVDSTEYKLSTWENYGDMLRREVERNNIYNSGNFFYSNLILTNILDAYFSYKDNKDKNVAVKKLNESIEMLKKDENLKANVYIEFMADSENAGPESGIVVKATQEMRKLDPNFDHFMDKVIKKHVENKRSQN